MKTDLVSRSEIWELVGEMAETVRPGSKLEGVMRRYANAIDNAPAVDAIPVEWMKQQFYDNPKSPWANECRDVYTGWLRWQKVQKEQEAR